MQTLEEARKELWSVVQNAPTEYSDEAICEWALRLNAAKRLVVDSVRTVRKQEKAARIMAEEEARREKSLAFWKMVIQRLHDEKQGVDKISVSDMAGIFKGYWHFRQEGKSHGLHIYKPQHEDFYYVYDFSILE